jgi:hypothetical protein
MDGRTWPAKDKQKVRICTMATSVAIYHIPVKRCFESVNRDLLIRQDWPLTDLTFLERQVDAIVGLVKDVCGAHLYTFFDDTENEGARQKRRGIVWRVKSFFTLWQHSGKPGHMLRRYFIRWACVGLQVLLSSSSKFATKALCLSSGVLHLPLPASPGHSDF